MDASPTGSEVDRRDNARATASAHAAAAVDRVAAHFGLRPREVLDLTSADGYSQVGEGAIWVGIDIDKAVSASITFDDGVDPRDLHLFYAFARPSSLVPHLAIEWGTAGENDVLLHVDLLPRVDVAVNTDYLREAYALLTPTLAEVQSLPGARPNPLPPTRAAGSSPWAISVRGPESLAGAFTAATDDYIDRWFSLSSGGIDARVDPVANDPSRLVQRDKYHRNALFDADADPRWSRVTRCLGPDRAAALRAALRTQEMR